MCFSYYIVYNRPRLLQIGVTFFKSGIVILIFYSRITFLRSELYAFYFCLNGRDIWEVRSVLCNFLYSLALYLIDPRTSVVIHVLPLCLYLLNLTNLMGTLFIFIFQSHQMIVNCIVFRVGISVWVYIYICYNSRILSQRAVLHKSLCCLVVFSRILNDPLNDCVIASSGSTESDLRIGVYYSCDWRDAFICQFTKYVINESPAPIVTNACWKYDLGEEAVSQHMI